MGFNNQLSAFGDTLFASKIVCLMGVTGFRWCRQLSIIFIQALAYLTTLVVPRNTRHVKGVIG